MKTMGMYFIIMLTSYVISSLTLWNEVFAQPNNTFNVTDFGAVGDGITDDSQAFAKAWTKICDANLESVILEIPYDKSFLVKPIKFEGPCKPSGVGIEVLGKIVAPNKLSDYPNPTPDSWLQFLNVEGLTLNGRGSRAAHGSIDGKGQVWWDTCNRTACPQRPAAAKFQQCNNLTIQNLKFFNSSNNHISITSCSGVYISHLHIQAPGDSPNTDGIDISSSNGIFIHNCNIGTGDDCVAIIHESHDINITELTCGPGHGISIGSLGKGGGNDTIENIHVSNCTFKDTQNGARIKTWQGGSGYARSITYEDIKFENASNPIFIDQFYCPQANCANQTNAVNVSNITFKRVFGTSYSEKAIVLHCSQNIGCTNIDIEQANITSSTPGVDTWADCFNAQVHSHGSYNVPSLRKCRRP